MAYYIKGIGDVITRTNEILPSFDARISHFIFKQDYGIAKDELFEFESYTIDRGVVVGTGMALAHGYFGLADTPTQINFIMPSSTSYSHIYAEIDLTIVPNKFSVKATPLTNTPEYEFTRDELLNAQNGIHQFPLYLITLTNNQITMEDCREFIYGAYAQNHSPTGGISDSLNERLPKLTLIAQKEVILVDPGGNGSKVITPTIPVTYGDVFLANCELQNVFGPLTFSGIVYLHYNQKAVLPLVKAQFEYNCVDCGGVEFKFNTDGTITFSGYPSTRYSIGQPNFEIGSGTAYSLLSLYKINLD